MRPAQCRLCVLLLLALFFEACPNAVGAHGLRWPQLACTRLRGGAGAAQKAARAKRARLRQERMPPPKARRSDQERMRDHVLVVDKDSGERYFELKTRSGVPVAVCCGNLRASNHACPAGVRKVRVKAHNDGDSMTPHKTPLQLYQLNQLLRQARENATGTLAAAQAPTTGKHAARSVSGETDDTGADPSVGEEGNARREEWQEILGDGSWVDKILAEEGGEVGTAGCQGGGLTTGIKYIKDQVPTPFEATAAEGKLLDSAAASGNATAQLKLALCYIYGTGGKDPHPAMARKLLHDAGIKGDPSASFCMGVCWARGFGGAANNATALRWFERAARRGHAHAQVNAGLAHLRGWRGVGTSLTGDTDTNKGIGFMTAAAKQGLVQAQLVLAMWYLHASQQAAALSAVSDQGERKNGQSIAEGEEEEREQDSGTALRWEGVTQKEASQRALKWFRRAGEGGHPWGAIMTAECYAKGIGVTANLNKTEKWLKVVDRLHGFNVPAHFERMLDSATPMQRTKSSWHAWDEQSEVADEDTDDASGRVGDRGLSIQVGIDGEWNQRFGGPGGPGLVGGRRSGQQMIQGRKYTDDELREIALRQGTMFRPGIGVRIPRGVVTTYTGTSSADGYSLEETYQAPQDADFDDARYMDYGATREQRRQQWWEELRRKQHYDIMMNNVPPPELLRYDRKRLVDAPILREMLHKFQHWDSIVEKRSLLKFEKVHESEAARRRAHRRYRGVGLLQGLQVQSSAALEQHTKDLEPKYGFGHGLRGWFGERVD